MWTAAETHISRPAAMQLGFRRSTSFGFNRYRPNFSMTHHRTRSIVKTSIRARRGGR